MRGEVGGADSLSVESLAAGVAVDGDSGGGRSPLTMFHFLPPQERRGAAAALEAAQPLPDQSQQRSEVTAAVASTRLASLIAAVERPC